MSHFSPIRRPSRAAGHLRERCLLPIRLQHKRAKSSRNIPPSLAISQPPAIFRNEPPNFSAPQFSVRRLDTLPIIEYNSKAIGVWRSLVSRLVRVQEAAGSNPATPTNKGKNAGISKSFRRFSCLSGCAWFLIDFTRTKRSDCHEKKSKNLNGSKGIRR